MKQRLLLIKYLSVHVAWAWLLSGLILPLQSNAASNEADLESDPTEVLAEPLDDSFNAADDYATAYQFDDSLDNQENLWDRMREGFSMPDLNSNYTAKHEQWYAARPDYMSRMLERSKKYLFHIVEEVEKRGMPTEIALLPMIESGFNPKALSTSKASGIWQFIPSTGTHFGLKQNYWSDSRKDVQAATQAALNYLQKLYTMFGAWDLALAAYNAGEGTVSRAIEKNRRLGLPTDYAHLSLPDETRNYVPKLQAIKNIIFRPDNYGVTLNNIPNRPYFSTVTAPKQIDAKLAAQLAGITQDEFNALNPSFNRPVIIANTDFQQLLLPTWSASNFVRNLANYDKPLSQWQTYHPRRGERVHQIADQFNIGVYELCAINNLRPNKNLVPRRPLLVPAGLTTHRTQPIDALAMAGYNLMPRDDVTPASSTRTHTVRRGDTVASVAKRYGVSTKALMRSNGLSKPRLTNGQTLRIELSNIASNRHGRTTRAEHHVTNSKGRKFRAESHTKHSKVTAKTSTHHKRRTK